MKNREFEPKLVSLLYEGYTRQQFGQDALAGLVVGIVAFPLAIAFAIASGVRPEQGLFTAIVAGFLISALGGSRVQIGGPTGAFVVIVYGIVQRFGYDGLAVATIMAGVLLIGMGVARLGAVIRFVPYPVTVGFTSGIALIIAVGQLRDALGLQMADVPAEFIAKWRAYSEHFASVNRWAVLLCALSVLLVQLWPKVTTKVPGPLAALLVTTLAAQLMGLPVETIGSRFGEVPSMLPSPRLPHVSWSSVRELVSPAVSIALLGGIESLLSAVVADGMTSRRHRSNVELIAQGIANIVSPLFGGMPATGAIARTATNVKNGGRTPIAGIVHAVVLLLILLVAGRWARLIPMATLAGILLVVAYNMSEWRVFVGLARGPRSDALVLVATFLLTVLLDLVAAIQVGVVLSALLFMRRMAEVTQVRAFTGQMSDEESHALDPTTQKLPPGVSVFEIRGSFFFGSARKFSDMVSLIQGRPEIVILRMRDVLSMDATGVHALEEVFLRFKKQGTHLLLSGVHAQPLFTLQTAGLVDRIGHENMFVVFKDAVTRAEELIAGKSIPPISRRRPSARP